MKRYSKKGIQNTQDEYMQPATRSTSNYSRRRRRARQLLCKVIRPFILIVLLTLTSWVHILTLDRPPMEYLNKFVLVFKEYFANLTVYELGRSQAFGQTNNRLVTILHALDYIMDKHGEAMMDGCSRNVVLSLSGWARETFDLFLSAGWTYELEHNLPIVVSDRVENKPGWKRVRQLKSGEMFYYTNWNYTDVASSSRLKRRRLFVLGKLLSLLLKENSQPYDMLTKHLRKNHLGEKYVTVHIRALDGECKWRLGSNLTHDECDMRPSYIKDLLRPHYGEDLSRVPIVVVSDMQRRGLLFRLKNDPEIGPNVIVPAWDLGDVEHSVVSDMVIAAKSDVFLGPRVSSMTIIIGQMRVALGADPTTNKIFVRESASPLAVNAEKYEVCGDCIFHCNNTVSNICGFKTIYA